MHPDIALAIAQTRSNDLIKQAEQYHLAAEARRGQKATSIAANPRPAAPLASGRMAPLFGHWMRTLRHHHRTA